MNNIIAHTLNTLANVFPEEKFTTQQYRLVYNIKMIITYCTYRYFQHVLNYRITNKITLNVQ